MSKIYAALAAFIAFIAGAFKIFSAGKDSGIEETENLSNKRAVRRANERNEIKRNIVISTDSDKRLRDKWQRD